MAVKGRPSRRGVSKGGPAVPLWLLLLLAVGLALAVTLRCRLTPKEASKAPPPPAKKEAPAQGSKTKAPAKRPQVTEPPPTAPESPPLTKTPAAAPAPLPAGGERKICLVIDDVGYRLDLAQTATEKLPKETTFAVIPFLPHSEDSAALFRDRGFPVILHCPMEPEKSGQWKAQPGTLMVGMPPQEVASILDLDLQGVPGAEGLNNHMGSLATTDRTLMDHVMASLRGRGLYFLDSRTSAATVAYDAARQAGVRTAFRSVFLDDVDEEDAIIRQIDLWAARSEREGSPVAIGHLRPRTIETLAYRLPYWRSKGVRLVALREVVH
jgi:uncharacterized protein